jgi:hypothetical protein
MRILDGQLVAFLGDSITQHLVAVSDWMETQTDGLPPVGTPVSVDRFENRGWTDILANRIRLAYPERFDAHVLAHHPHWLLLSAGVVEVRRLYQPDRADERVFIEEYIANLTTMTILARAANLQVIFLEPTPHARPVTDGPPEVTLEDVNSRTREYTAAMMQVADTMGVGFVSLFETFLDTEKRLEGKASLYADDVHLGALGDHLYSQLVFQYLDSQ